MNIETFFNTNQSKRFYFPGKIVIGAGVSNQSLEIIDSFKSVAVIVDRVFSQSHLLKEIKSKFSAKRCDIYVIDGAPFAQDVLEFISYINGTPELILSIGGGSASDFAKSMILYELFGSIEGIGVGEKRGIKPRPDSKRPTYIAIPTTAGSGAEASRYYVVYDKVTRGKVYGKTWQIVADWIFLDPQLLISTPNQILVGCAFDAFVHLFESLIAKHEKSMFGEMFSLCGMPKIMNAIQQLVIENKRELSFYEDLQYSATLAGVAISNVRTGSIHEAAGALLELTSLNHAETLFVFFRTAIEQYVLKIAEPEKKLVGSIANYPSLTNIRSLSDIISWWEIVFDRVNLTEKIRAEIKVIEPNLCAAQEHIFQRVFSDKVWVTKESPSVLEEIDVRYLVDHSLRRFGVDIKPEYKK